MNGDGALNYADYDIEAHGAIEMLFSLCDINGDENITV